MATVIPPPTRPDPVFNLPNQLTAARLVLAVVLFGLIAWGLWVGCLVVFLAAAVTDWLDGYFARKQGLNTPLGRNFDPLVDKVLVCGAYIFLMAVPEAGLAPWMVTVVVGRELIITGLRSFMENRGASFGADMLGKIKMVMQCIALIAIFLALKMPDWSAESVNTFKLIAVACIYAMVVATALSGLQYVIRATLLLRSDD